jgi:hypothetical protein
VTGIESRYRPRRRTLLERLGLSAAAVSIVIAAGVVAATSGRDPFVEERLAQLYSDVQAYDGQLGEHPGMTAACTVARDQYNVEASKLVRWPEANGGLPRRIDVDDPATDCRAS